ncbi:MAG: sugar ABC transporter permease [Gemmatimonadota bacterium]|nr:sugar ABC transporter permease [Gemmatimonadota bacterium]
MEREKRRLAYFYVAPAAVWLFLFMGYPILDVMETSLYHTSYKGETFAGIGNYIGLLQDDLFLLVLKNTALWTALAVAMNVGLGLGVALLLSRESVLSEWVRGMLILAWAMPLVVAAITWKWMYNGEYGHLNSLLLGLQLIDSPVQWLTDASTAFAGALVARLWTALPFTTFAFLSALQSIPGDLYEASRIDGATEFRQFRHITLPLLRPVTLAVLLVSVIWSFNSFVFIYVITAGGPANQTQIIVTEIYRRAFGYFNFGQAGALTVLAFFLLLGISLLQWRVFYRREA